MKPERTARKILEWIPPEGRRNRGRPRLSWRGNVERDLEAMGTSWQKTKEEAQDRTGWRRTARCATSRGTGGTKC